jgi:hypothetical protein
MYICWIKLYDSYSLIHHPLVVITLEPKKEATYPDLRKRYPKSHGLTARHIIC